MKTTTLLLLSLLTIFTVVGQSDKETKKILNDAPFVFKGFVKGIKGFKKEGDNQLYLSYTLRIDSIYKGDGILKKGTVEVIAKSPGGYDLSEEGYLISNPMIPEFESEYAYINADYPFSLGYGTTVVLACNSTLEYKSSRINLTDNNIRLVPVCTTNKCAYIFQKMGIINKEEKIVGQSMVSGFRKYFTTEEDFHTYLNTMLGLPSSKKKDVLVLEEEKVDRALYAQRVQKSQEYQKILQERISNRRKDKNNNGLEDVYFEISNQHVTGGAPQFFEFDILISGNSEATYLNNTAFVIQYNTAVFGDSIVLNNTVTITRGDEYDTPTYIDPMTIMTDDNFNAMRCGLVLERSMNKVRGIEPM